MTLLNIDRQPGVVKRFFESLTLTPEGTVVELDGRPVARMLPANSRDDTWTELKNQRRLALIDREIADVVTADEALELELLQEELQFHMERVAPLPLDYARQLHLILSAQASTVHGSP